MTSAQIQGLLQGPNHSDSVNYAIHAINASFSSLQLVNSGSTLTDVTESARATSEAYNTQLVESQQNVYELIRETRTKAREQLVTAQELSLLRHSLADELSSLDEELESSAASEGDGPSLLEEIEALHRNLKELESVKGYVQVIHRALQLSEKAIKDIQNAPQALPISEATLANYVLLQQLVRSIKIGCGQAEGSTGQDIKIVSFLTDLVDKTWLRIKDVLASTLLSAAEGLHWPMPVDYAAAKLDIRRAFENAFANLLNLQEIGDRLNANQDTTKPSKDGIYPLQALVRPISQRFKYHFEGTRQTNRLDKPEWYFAHILNVSHEHRPLLELMIQRLLQSSKYSWINAWREFTRLLLPILGRKLRRSIPTLLPHPPLLAHTIYQALAFDEALKEAGFDLAGTYEKSTEATEWEGTSDIILGNVIWFDTWVEGERKFARNQYNGIITSPDAWQFSDESEEEAGSSDTEVRPTNSARRVKALLEQITDRYKALPRFRHRTRFLVTVQIPILELYHTGISDQLDSYESLSSFLTRVVPGALAVQASHARDGESVTSGVDGAKRLVKAFVSTKWMAHVMSAWGEDMFFLELWHQICENASLRSWVRGIDALPDPNVINDEGTIFQKLVAQYNKLAGRAEDMLVRQITGEVEAELKEHLFKQPDASVDGENPVVPQTFLKPLNQLSGHLSSLTNILPAPTAINLYRRISGHIANHVLQRQVSYRGRSRMSLAEGRSVLHEANYWVKASRKAMAPSGLRRVEGPWERLLDAGRLLSLEGEEFRRVVNAVRLGDDKQYELIAEELGISEMNTEEVLKVLNVREDFPR